MVITGLTRNQFAGNRTWVRIPPSPPQSLAAQGLQGFFVPLERWRVVMLRAIQVQPAWLLKACADACRCGKDHPTKKLFIPEMYVDIPDCTQTNIVLLYC